MKNSTMDTIESAICSDETLTPESAGLICSIIAGTAVPLSISEVCGVFGASPAMVRAWTFQSVLEPCSWSGEVLFSPEKVWAFWLEDSEEEIK